MASHSDPPLALESMQSPCMQDETLIISRQAITHSSPEQNTSNSACALVEIDSSFLVRLLGGKPSLSHAVRTSDKRLQSLQAASNDRNYLTTMNPSHQNFSSLLPYPSHINTPRSAPNILPLKQSKSTVEAAALPANTSSSLKRKRRDDNKALVPRPIVIGTSKCRTKKCKTTKDNSCSRIIDSGKLCDDIWMRIFELTDSRFLNTKGRLICRRFTEIIDHHNSIFVNQRVETYGRNMPGPPPGVSERKYSNLLGGKGCEDCPDRACTAAKWAWFKRWCTSCWGKRIIREDRVVKKYQNDFSQNVIVQMLKCLPYCMHDSYMKPHDISEDRDSRPSGGPKVHKYFQIQDVAAIVTSLNAITVTPEEEASASLESQELASVLNEKRKRFFAEKEKENNELIDRVRKIEIGVRMRRREIAQPNENARKGRREYHTRMARIDLPHIPIEFIQAGRAYKASCRIYRNSGTERTWKALKPKIENEWKREIYNRTVAAAAAASNAVTQIASIESYRQFLQCNLLGHNSLHQKLLDLDRHNMTAQCHISATNMHHSIVMPHLQTPNNFPNSAEHNRHIPYRLTGNEDEYSKSQNYHGEFCQSQSVLEVTDTNELTPTFKKSSLKSNFNIYGRQMPPKSHSNLYFGLLSHSGDPIVDASNHYTYKSTALHTDLYSTNSSFIRYTDASIDSGSLNSKTTIPVSSLLSTDSSATNLPKASSVEIKIS